MTDNVKSYGFEFDFAYDDVSKGLYDITAAGKDVVKVFLNMADQIALSSTKAGKAATVAVDPLTAIGKAVDVTLKNVTRNLETIERQVRQVDMSSLEKSADKYGEMIKKAQGHLNALHAEAEKVKSNEEEHLKVLQKILDVQGQITQMEKAQGQIQKYAEQERAQQRAADAQKQADAQAKADAKALAAQQAEAARQAKADAKELAEIEREITRESEARLKQAAKDQKAQEKANAQALKVAALEAADALKKLEQAEKDAERQARELESSQKAVSQSIVGMASEIRGPAVALSASIGLLYGASLKQFAGLSDQMTTFKAVTNATGDEIAYMVKEAKAIEGIPTEQAAKASVALARAGLSAKDAAGALGIMGKAAIVAGEDLESTASLILATNRAYGQSNAELEKTGDIMAKVANATNSSIGEIGHAMSIMGSSAKANNQTLLSTATIFGLLRDQGVSAEMAATGYKNGLNALATPAKQTREAMDQLYKTTDAAKKVFTENGKMKDFGVILDELKSKLKGFDDVSQANILEKIFPDERSMNIVRSYFNITDEKIKATTDEINKYAGTIRETAEIMEGSMGHKLRALSKDFEDFKSGLGEDAAPVLGAFVDLLRDIIKGYQDLSEPIKVVVANGLLAVAGITSLIGVASQLVISIGGAVFAWNQYTAAAGRASAANALAGKSAESATVGLNTALTKASLLSNVSFGVLTAGLATVAAEIWLIVDAYNAWQKAEEDRRAFEADARSNPNEGALAAIKNLPYEDITGDQANKAARDAQFQDRLLRSQLKDLHEIKNLGDMQTRGVATIADREKQMALFHKLREAGLAMDDVNAEINRVRHQIDALRPQLGRANSLNELLNQGRPTAPVTPTAGTQDNQGAADAKTNEFIRALDARFDKRLNDQILASKQTAKGVPVSNEGIMRSNLFAKELFPDVSADELVDKTLAFFKSDSGLTRFLVEAIEKGLSPLQYNAYLNEGDENGYTRMHDKAFQLGITDKRETELTPANMQALQKYFGQIGYKQEGATNVEMLASLFQMNLKEFNAFMDETIYPDKPMNWTPDEIVDAIFKADFSQTDFNQPFNPNAKDGQQDVWAFFKEYFSNAMSETGNPGARFSTANLQGQPGETQDQIEARLKVVNIEERITALRAEQAKYTDVESKEYKNLNQEITRREAELSAAKGQSIDKDKAAEKERIANAKAVATDLRQIYTRNRDAEIAAMEEGADKIEALRKKDLEDNQAELAAKLDGFKGDVNDRNKLIEGYLKQQAIINKKYDEQQKDDARRHHLALRALDNEYTQSQIDSMEDGLQKQIAVIELEAKKKKEGYDDQLTELRKNENENIKEIERIEALKAQAAASASKRLKEAVIQDEIDKATFRKEAVKEALNDDQRAFDASLKQMIDQKKKRGVKPADLGRSLDPDEIFNLAESLGQSSLDDLLGNLQEQLKATDALKEAEAKRRDSFEVGSDRYKASFKVVLGYMAESAEIQEKLNALSDKNFVNGVNGFQDVLLRLQRINKEQAIFNTLVESVSGTLSLFAGMFGEMGRNIASGINLVANAATSVDKIVANVQKMGNTKNPIETFFGKLSNVQDVVGLITTGVGLVGQLITGLIDSQNEARKAVLEATRASVDYRDQQELAALRQEIASLKSSGRNTSDLEGVYNEAQYQASVGKLSRDSGFGYYYPGSDGKTPFSPQRIQQYLDQGGQFYGPVAPKLYEILETFNQLTEDRDRENERIEKDRQTRQTEQHRAHYERLAEIQIDIAGTTEDKLDDIRADAFSKRQQLDLEYFAQTMAILAAGLSPELFTQALTSLNEWYKGKVAGLDKATADQTRNAGIEKMAADRNAYHDHQEALVGMMEDGAAKELKLKEIAHQRNLANLADEILKLSLIHI